MGHRNSNERLKNHTQDDSYSRTLSRQKDARSLAIANRGVQTAPQFAQLMSALISDLASQRLAPNIANAMVNAGGKMLKCVEMQYKYGKTKDSGEAIPLRLA